jgi:heat shock protein HslJ
MKKYILCLFLFFWIGKSVDAQRIGKATWDCQYILSKDSAGGIAMEKMQGIGSIRFVGDSTIDITTLCNTGSAKTKMSSDSTLRFADIAMTFLWCDQGDKESIFIKHLRLTSSFAINESGLKLYFNNKKGYMFFVRQ